MERDYRNVGYALLALPVIMVIGFWIPYFSQIPHFEALITPAVHAHAIVQFGWIALLVAQPLLIRGNAFRMHRTLGKFTYALMPLIALLSILMMHKEYQENIAQGTPPMHALLDEFLSCIQLLLFVLFYVLAIAHARRRQIGAHLRYMVCIALILLPAGLARALGYWFDVRQKNAQTVCLALIIATLVGLIARDRRHGSSFRPYGLALGSYIVIGLVWALLGRPV
ncbi:MAG TPA: hypothetical protein VGI93_06975 [Steroidobacteraceae bacterium]|jgi:hypothetical protein